MANLGNLFGGTQPGPTTPFIDPTPFVQYEQQQGALGAISPRATRGIGPSTMTAQALAGNDLQAAANAWQLTAQEQQNLMRQQDIQTQFANQANNLQGGGLGTLLGLK